MTRQSATFRFGEITDQTYWVFQKMSCKKEKEKVEKNYYLFIGTED
jgi:hypothetical protein